MEHLSALKPEAECRKRRGVLGEGSEHPLCQLRGLRKHCKLHSGSRGKASAAQGLMSAVSTENGLT